MTKKLKKKRRAANRKPRRLPKLSVRQAIEALVAEGRPFGVGEIVSCTGVSRQAAHRQLAAGVAAGTIASRGNGRATRYVSKVPPPVVGSTVMPMLFERRYATAGLAEDEVWRQVEAALPMLSTKTGKNTKAIVAYAFTEMINNAIDHSASDEVLVRAGGDGDQIWFEVKDTGIGAFENVRRTFALPDPLAGLQEISKGKRTTQADRHTGEGIFFTSKMADRFELAANGLCWLVDNLRQDHAIGQASSQPGTTVRFEVATDKKEAPEAFFARYTHGFEFDTTRTIVKLFEYGVRFVSRSEAKRLLQGLERFRHVVLDFVGVESVGQGFADEIFRVWALAHPDVALHPENMATPVAFMVARARRPPSPASPI